MSSASLFRRALITSAALATAVVLPLAGIETVAPARATTATTATASTATTALTATQVAAIKRHNAWLKKRAHRLAVRRAHARKVAHQRAVHRAVMLRKARIARKRGALLIHVAAKYKGRPYVYGASGPRAFDCSGYTSFVVRRALHINLPRTAAQQAHASRVRHVSRSHRMIGDLVFTHTGGGISHVAIYAGNGMVWESPHSGSHVQRKRMYSSNVSYGRIV